MKKLFALILMCVAVSASATLTYPKNMNMDQGSFINDGSVYYLGEQELGSAAPGQDLKLSFSRNTGEGNSVSDASVFWDRLDGNLVQERTPSSIDAVFKVPSDIRGEYLFNVTLLGSDLRTIVPHLITFKIFIKERIYTYSYENTSVMPAGSPQTFMLNIKSESAAPETLIFRNSGEMPNEWFTIQDVKMQPWGSVDVPITVNANEEGYYVTNMVVVRSAEMRDSLPLSIRVKPTLSSKLKAFEEGFAIAPVMMQPFYSLLSMLGTIF